MSLVTTGPNAAKSALTVGVTSYGIYSDGTTIWLTNSTFGSNQLYTYQIAGFSSTSSPTIITNSNLNSPHLVSLFIIIIIFFV